MNSTTLHSTSRSFNTKVCPHVRQVILEDFRLQFLQPNIIDRSYAFYMPFYPLEIIYIRSAPHHLKHAHSSPLVLPQYKHFKQKNVRTLQQRSQTKSTHLNLCISHSASTLGPVKLAMDLTPCNKDPLPLQPQCILPPVIPCDVTLHYTAYTTEYTKRWLSFRSPINMLACVCTPALNKHKYSRFHTTIGTFIIRMGQFVEMLRNRSIHYAVCIFRYFAK